MAVSDVYFNVLMNFDEGINIQIRHFTWFTQFKPNSVIEILATTNQY